MQADAIVQAVAREVADGHPDILNRPRLAHVEIVPARPPAWAPLPGSVPAVLVDRLRRAEIEQLYSHQAEAYERITAGEHIVVATGTASGKSLCYQLPLMEALLSDDKATALYLSPTKALARDQVRALRAFRLPQVRAAAYDGDTSRAERDSIRRTANVILTNPDMLHIGMLPAHRRWGDFLHRLRLVVVDECHVARGVFGSHIAAILRRMRRVCGYYGSSPTFVLASATIGNPGGHATALTGLNVRAIGADGAPRSRTVVGLWEPPLIDEQVRDRRSTLVEGTDVLTQIAGRGLTTLAFIKSRTGAEIVAAAGQRALPEHRVRAYRAGLLPEERRAVEHGLADGTIQAVATTDALELGMDVGALDAVVIIGWPGTAASFWQQAGRAGRRGQDALVVFVADDNPLDHYLLAHPDRLLGRPLEHAIVDVTNPYVLRPHLRCAAWELPLRRSEDGFAPAEVGQLVEEEVAVGRLRERGDSLYWAGRGSPAQEVNIRSIGGDPFMIVERDSGAVVGDVDQARAFRTVHAGATYLHAGRSYRIERLDLKQRVALAVPHDGTTFTRPRTDTDITVSEQQAQRPWGRCLLSFGRVDVSTQVLSYEHRRVFTGELLDVGEVDLPPQALATQALWLSIPDPVLSGAGLSGAQVAGAAHAAEHAAIGMLPLLAMCDRWDIGGVSTPWHPDTRQATIFIYDGIPGGAGIAERAFETDDTLFRLTRDAIAACDCRDGCPSCVQSPKCGNNNQPLDKWGAVALLEAALNERE